MYTTKLSEIKTKLETDFENGLTSQEVTARQSQNEKNELDKQAKNGFLKKFFAQFKDTMIIVLIIAGLISLFVKIETHSSLFEPMIIFVLVISNALIGSIQEMRAEKALNALKNITSKTAKVIRDGNSIEIKSTELVVGDIIILESGDIVPADARVLSCSNFQVDESSLTGESKPVTKNTKAVDERATLSERTCMIYSGTIATYGNATAIVCAIGMNTELGKIASLLNNTKRIKTPLQNRLSKLANLLSIIALISCFAVFVLGWLTEMDLTEIFLNAISLAIASIPESLPAIVTIILALGVERLVKDKAIIKELPAVETLGCTSVICTDKTGTLTQNKMTVVSIYSSTTNTIIEDLQNEEAKNILQLASICCNSTKIIGDPTERAIIIASNNAQFIKEHPIYFQLPFDSERKMMTTIHKTEDGYIIVTKGAFERVNKVCSSVDDKNQLINNRFASEGQRVLAIAYKKLKNLPDDLSIQNLEKNLKLLGLISISDPPREEVKYSINLCRSAGIKVVMITGDNPLTAGSIAKQVGILNENEKVITGDELAQMDEEQLLNEIEYISVYARVSPLDKVRIVQAWQKKGKVVAMTGDGVNDAPALKNADIGCAMGITGSDVAKNSSDIILTDDNFETIVHSVKEGRGVYANIKKVVGFLVGTSFCEVITVFFSIVLFGICPLISVQLLWINLITDSFPAIALGLDKIEDDVMKQPPRHKNEGLFGKNFGLLIALTCIVLAGISILGFYLGLTIGGSVAMGSTMAYLILGVSQLLHSHNLHSKKSIFKSFFTNKRLTLFNTIALILLLVIAFIPNIASLFNMVIMPWYMYLIAFGLSLTPIIICEILKAFKLMKHF